MGGVGFPEVDGVEGYLNAIRRIRRRYEKHEEEVLFFFAERWTEVGVAAVCDEGDGFRDSEGACWWT